MPPQSGCRAWTQHDNKRSAERRAQANPWRTATSELCEEGGGTWVQRYAREGGSRCRRRPLRDPARRCAGRHAWGMPGGPGTPPPALILVRTAALVSSLSDGRVWEWETACICHKDYLRCALPMQAILMRSRTTSAIQIKFLDCCGLQAKCWLHCWALST